MQGDAVLVQFTGEQQGSVTLRNPATGNSYKLGNNAASRHAYVQPADLAWLMARLPLQRVAQPPKAEPAPAPLPIAYGLAPDAEAEDIREATPEEVQQWIAMRGGPDAVREQAAIGMTIAQRLVAAQVETADTAELDAILAQAEAALSDDATGDHIAVNTPAQSDAPRRGRKANHA